MNSRSIFLLFFGVVTFSCMAQKRMTDEWMAGLSFMNSGTNLNNQLRENSGNPKFLFEPNQFGMLKIKNAWKEKFYPNNEKHEPKLNE